MGTPPETSGKGSAPPSPDARAGSAETRLGTESTENRREGVRQAIVDALAKELDRTSLRTVARLAAAALLGAAGAVGSVWAFCAVSLGTRGEWLLVACAAAWAAWLALCFDVILLAIRIERVPVRDASKLALVALPLAAGLAWLCADSHYLAWWESTRLGGLVAERWGVGASAFCLGGCSALLVGSGAAFIAGLGRRRTAGSCVPAFALVLGLWPVVALQSAAAPGSFLAWSGGLVAGCFAGMALGRWSVERVIGHAA